MAGRACISLWVRGFSEQSMLELYGKLLSTIPFSAALPGLTALLIRAVDSTQASLEEYDLRAAPAAPEGCIQLCHDHQHFDAAYEARAHWDVWSADSGTWKQEPHPLLLVCHGEEFDEGVFRELGHFQIDLGFDSLFLHDGPAAGLEKIRHNIRALHDWLLRIQEALPVERYLLWSEEEENFEARMDDVLARF
jgi:hypothetical protein